MKLQLWGMWLDVTAVCYSSSMAMENHLVIILNMESRTCYHHHCHQNRYHHHHHHHHHHYFITKIIIDYCITAILLNNNIQLKYFLSHFSYIAKQKDLVNYFLSSHFYLYNILLSILQLTAHILKQSKRIISTLLFSSSNSTKIILLFALIFSTYYSVPNKRRLHWCDRNHTKWFSSKNTDVVIYIHHCIIIFHI